MTETETEFEPIVVLDGPPVEPPGLTKLQVRQLVAPIDPRRVLKANNQSHVSQQDVTAHLTRVFGFGGFDTELLSLDLVFEAERLNSQTGELNGRWDCCYQATMRLTVKDRYGTEIAHYEDGSTGESQNQPGRAAAHDLAMKSAISLAKKRCAINLGDQFGLSLYNKGQTAALVSPGGRVPLGNQHLFDDDADESDVQANVPAQVSLGNDETKYEGEAAYGIEDLVARVEVATTEDELRVIWLDAGAANLLEEEALPGQTVAQVIVEARAGLQTEQPPVAPENEGEKA